MDVILIYQCLECGVMSRVMLSSVSVREELQLEKRMPEGWLINRVGKETYFCPNCQNKPSKGTIIS